MTAFNLSIDFELGWGDLRRVGGDAAFRLRVRRGREQTPEILATLARSGLPSTWGVVGGCCADGLEELRVRAPQPFAALEPQLAALMRQCADYRETLFCGDVVATIAKTPGVELASHGFLHLVPAGLPITVLKSDVAASVASLRAFRGAPPESFIPPQNYAWPDEVFADSPIRYVRHTPRVAGYAYSDPRTPAKLARLWNDLVRPAVSANRAGDTARLLFLRIDRGAALWRMQLRLIRHLLLARSGALYCFSHPHNLDTALLVRRFAELCDLISEAASRGAVTFCRFLREPQRAARVGPGETACPRS